MVFKLQEFHRKDPERARSWTHMEQVSAAAQTLRSARISMQPSQQKFPDIELDAKTLSQGDNEIEGSKSQDHVPQMTRRGSMPRQPVISGRLSSLSKEEKRKEEKGKEDNIQEKGSQGEEISKVKDKEKKPKFLSGKLGRSLRQKAKKESESEYQASFIPILYCNVTVRSYNDKSPYLKQSIIDQLVAILVSNWQCTQSSESWYNIV